jgi:coproporphyrinogen III oxidase-like Fe-S oxidoreductase
MGLRLAEGMSLRSLADRTGYTIADDARQLLAREGLLTAAGADGTLTASPQGRLLLNSLIAHLAAALVPADSLAAAM